ncbi:OmpA family protein [Eleftheria terrae]|uniref:OmpA family protein n=1 Tax=Eleftheria terrae TaxID=1597781 RepID=UPI00263AD834|nr:OmpA family protein [Eleftheria terrae]WKB53773.1 OmpA family protein [Eleftheria terrae]
MSQPTSPLLARAALAVALAAALAACGDKAAEAPPAPSVDTAAPAPAGQAVLFEANQTVAVTGPEFVAWRDRMLAEGGSTKVLQVTGRAYGNEQANGGEDLGRARAEAASILFMETLPPERIVLKSAPASGSAPAGRFEAVSFEWVDAPSTAVAAAPGASAGSEPAGTVVAAAPAEAGVASAPAAAPGSSGAAVPGSAAAPAPTPAPAPAPAPAAAASPVPAPAAPPTATATAAAAQASAMTLFFATGSSTPRPSAAQREQLKALVAAAGGGRPIVVVGHADQQGDSARNQALSEARARAVKQLLVGLGAKPEGVDASARGDAQPREGNDTAAGRARNRRVEIAVL